MNASEEEGERAKSRAPNLGMMNWVMMNEEGNGIAKERLDENVSRDIQLVITFTSLSPTRDHSSFLKILYYVSRDNLFSFTHQASIFGSLATLTSNVDPNGLIALRSTSSLSLRPGRLARAPVTKMPETNRVWKAREKRFYFISFLWCCWRWRVHFRKRRYVDTMVRVCSSTY